MAKIIILHFLILHHCSSAFFLVRSWSPRASVFTPGTRSLWALPSGRSLKPVTWAWTRWRTLLLTSYLAEPVSLFLALRMNWPMKWTVWFLTEISKTEITVWERVWSLKKRRTRSFLWCVFASAVEKKRKWTWQHTWNNDVTQAGRQFCLLCFL